VNATSLTSLASVYNTVSFSGVTLIFGGSTQHTGQLVKKNNEAIKTIIININFFIINSFMLYFILFLVGLFLFNSTLKD